MLSDQLSKGNNGLVKLKFVTFSVEAENMSAAKARLNRIETDMLNNFKVLGVSAHSMNGYKERYSISLFKSFNTGFVGILFICISIILKIQD